MIEFNLTEIRRRLYEDDCLDILRGVACLRHQLLNGVPYAEAVAVWKKCLPELFSKHAVRQREQAGSRVAERMFEPPPDPRDTRHAGRGRKDWRHAYG